MTTRRSRRSGRLRRYIVTAIVLCGAGVAAAAISHAHGPRPRLAEATPAPAADPAADIGGARDLSAAPSSSAPPSRPSTHRPAALPDMCRGNTDGQRVIVSIRQQHAWMCAGARQVYTTAATTGASALGDDTPTGTWHVLAKQTERWLTVLSGDSYFVKYWVPYDGPYGFHDASWQKFAYGSQQYRTDGSHGCVHLPLPAMAWFYNWAQVGTAVTITT